MGNPEQAHHIRGRPKERQKGLQKTILLYPRDVSMVDELMQHFGSDSRSDVIRTAIRTLYVSLLGKSNA